MNSSLARELRENSDYLREAGFKSTATLMEAAANELDRLSIRNAELERARSFGSISRLLGFRPTPQPDGASKY